MGSLYPSFLASLNASLVSLSAALWPLVISSLVFWMLVLSSTYLLVMPSSLLKNSSWSMFLFSRSLLSTLISSTSRFFIRSSLSRSISSTSSSCLLPSSSFFNCPLLSNDNFSSFSFSFSSCYNYTVGFYYEGLTTSGFNLGYPWGGCKGKSVISRSWWVRYCLSALTCFIFSRLSILGRDFSDRTDWLSNYLGGSSSFCRFFMEISMICCMKLQSSALLMTVLLIWDWTNEMISSHRLASSSLSLSNEEASHSSILLALFLIILLSFSFIVTS